MIATTSLNPLESRRKELGMTTQVLARRSRVSRSTVCRILQGEYSSVTHGNLAAVAQALGMRFSLEPEVGAREYLERAAEKKARYAVAMVQGTMGLEEQGVKPEVEEQLFQEVKGELLSGSRRKVWR